MPQPAVIAELERPLAQAYADAWRLVKRLEAELTRDPALARQRRRLREIEASIRGAMRDLDPTTRAWLRTELPEVYAIGGRTAAMELGTSQFTWTQIHREAVDRLANGLYVDLLKSTRYVQRTTKTFIRTVLHDQALQKALLGRTATDAGRRMSRIIADNGIHAIRYANGARMPLDAYSQMAMRTVTANAYNEGTLNSGAERGIKFWEVFDGPSCGWTFHNDTEPALGKIVTRDESLGYPIAHPNCRRAFGSRPDVRTDAQAGRAKPSVSREQVLAQVRQDLALGKTDSARFLTRAEKMRVG